MCVSEVLHAEHRNGVELDVCGKCRGIWLDRGELEKLAVPPQPPGPGARRFEGEAPERPSDARSSGRDDDDDEWRPKGKKRGKRDDEWRSRRKKAKKSFGERLADVFDDILD